MASLASAIGTGLLYSGFGLAHLFASSSEKVFPSPKPDASSSSLSSQMRIRHSGSELVPVLPGRIQLFIILGLAPLAVAYQLLVGTSFDPLVQGGTPVFRSATYLHSASISVFALFAVAALIHGWLSPEMARLIPRGALFGLAALAFGFQWQVLQFEAHIVEGLEGQCNLMLATLSSFCGLTCLSLAFFEHSSQGDLILGMGILLQGLWRLQVGLSLHVDAFIPKGCHRLLGVSGSVEGSTRCDVKEMEERAIGIMNILFVCHAILAIVVSIAVQTHAVITRGLLFGQSPRYTTRVQTELQPLTNGGALQ